MLDLNIVRHVHLTSKLLAKFWYEIIVDAKKIIFDVTLFTP